MENVINSPDGISLLYLEPEAFELWINHEYNTASINEYQICLDLKSINIEEHIWTIAIGVSKCSLGVLIQFDCITMN